MPRPNKILSPTKNYNLNIKIEAAKYAHKYAARKGQKNKDKIWLIKDTMEV